MRKDIHGFQMLTFSVPTPQGWHLGVWVQQLLGGMFLSIHTFTYKFVKGEAKLHYMSMSCLLWIGLISRGLHYHCGHMQFNRGRFKFNKSKLLFRSELWQSGTYCLEKDSALPPSRWQKSILHYQVFIDDHMTCKVFLWPRHQRPQNIHTTPHSWGTEWSILQKIHHAGSPTFPLFCCHGRNELLGGIHVQNKFW